MEDVEDVEMHEEMHEEVQQVERMCPWEIVIYDVRNVCFQRQQIKASKSV